MLHSFDRDLEITERLETEYVRVLFYELPADYSEWYRSYENIQDYAPYWKAK